VTTEKLMESKALTLEKKLSDLQKATVNFVTPDCASVCPHEKSRLPIYMQGVIKNYRDLVSENYSSLLMAKTI
jgi:hypothetical protein